MEDHLLIVFYIAVPVVILVSVFVYYLSQREDDVERVSQSQVPPPEEDRDSGTRSQNK